MDSVQIHSDGLLFIRVRKVWKRVLSLRAFLCRAYCHEWISLKFGAYHGASRCCLCAAIFFAI